jgi:hypothetical protein
MIERSRKGFLTYDSKAALAIKGMPPGEISDKAELIERQYYQWLGVEINDDGLVASKRWFTGLRRMILWIARRPMGIFRLEVAELGLACAKLLNDKRAAASQQEFYSQYVKMVKENQELHSFLYEHFRHDLAEAEVRDIPLSQLVKELLLRQRVAK